MTSNKTSISIEKARELLGGESCKFSNKKILMIVGSLEELSDSIIDILDEEPALLESILGFVGKSKEATIRNRNEQK